MVSVVHERISALRAKASAVLLWSIGTVPREELILRRNVPLRVNFCRKKFWFQQRGVVGAIDSRINAFRARVRAVLLLGLLNGL